MDTISLLHVLGIGLLIAGGLLSLAAGETIIALISFILAVIIGFSFNQRQGNGKQATT